MSVEITPSFDTLLAEYKNTAEHNDHLFKQLTSLTWTDSILSAHRRHVEKNELGFGDAAFHAMWLRMMDKVQCRSGTVRALEIGVFKGQVISLWALIGQKWNMDIHISAITPLVGQPMPRSRLIRWLRACFDQKFSERLDNGDFYAKEDYVRVIKRLFVHFNVDFSAVELFHGYSTDAHVLKSVENSIFDVIYVDGAHTFEGASHDFRTFGPKVSKGGWLVADDAGFLLPGTVFWKGHEAVSRAAKILPDLGFRNVMNVGHNRIFERVG
jgi:hypothetical protein